MQLTTPRKAALSTIGALALVGALFTPAAAAKGGKDAAPGQAKKDAPAAATWTEDNDTNDGGTPNNVADSGDNRHPSGKDRSVEHGKSGNQGKATSDPDNNGKGPERNSGGADKPNGKGGIDKADQDGNNGCGNDDDFEDDNEGWCGRKPKADKPAKPSTEKPGKPAGEKPKTENPGKPAKPAPEKPKAENPGKPGGADKPKGPKHENKPAKPGKGTASITVDADCRSVRVTSSKDISHVVVWFADGTSKKWDGLRGHTWSMSFDKDVAGARAKSATTVVSDAASCGSTAGNPSTTCPAGMIDTNGSAAGGCVQVETGAPGSVDIGACPKGMVDTNGSMAGGCECPKGMEDTNGSREGGCECPKGMEDTNGSRPGGCVLADDDEGTTVGGGAGAEPPAGEVLSSGAERPAEVSARSTGAVLSVGALAFTGAGLSILVAVALGLLLLGFVLVRNRRLRHAEATARR